MKSHIAASTAGPIGPHDAQDFSVLSGGPLFRLLRRVNLSDDALMRVRRRALVISLIAWLPLLILSALEGRALGGSVTLPFLLDVEAHVRFLVAMPLLIVAELIVHRRMLPLARQFLDRHLVPAGSMRKFEQALASALRLRDSTLAEAVLIALVYGIGILVIWRQYVALDTTTWYATPSGEGRDLSLAGVWYGYLSLPIFQFLLCRWYFRMFIWALFLWRVSRIELSLVPTHPDRVGGLGFLGNTVIAFIVLATAHGALLAGHLTNRILFAGATLLDFKPEIAGLVVLILLVFLGPLCVFAVQLERAKLKGLREYGTLAERYVRDFDGKWLRGRVPADEPLVGSADIQSLADLGNSYEVIRTMRVTPITIDAVVMLVVAVLAPIMPVLLTMMSLEDVVKKLLAILY